jgi:phosphatidylethanolamine/phosphatidyl-N-methylethanolamine N-methyltransferase
MKASPMNRPQQSSQGRGRVPAINRLRPQPDNRLAFFRGFVARPKEVGSIIPSSRFLERRIIRSAEVEHARVVIELGPGTGGTTRALLRAMPFEAKLLAIEINPRFVELLRETRDPRLLVHHGSATDIREALDAYDLPDPDVILSGIPFSTMTRDVGTQILRAVHDALAPHGRFIAYQVRDRVGKLGGDVFGRAKVQREILNVPPMRVYRWDKAQSVGSR